MGLPVKPCTGFGSVGPVCWQEASKEIVRKAREISQKAGRPKSAPWHKTHLWKGLPEVIPCTPKDVPGPALLAKKPMLGICALDTRKTQEAGTAEEPCIPELSKQIRGPPWLTKLPLPFFRDFTIMQNNTIMQTYAKDTREVVAHLRQAFIETNEELMRLVKAKEELDRAHVNIRKDMLVNKQSKTLRTFRPQCEKVFPEKGVLPPPVTVYHVLQWAALRIIFSHAWKPELPDKADCILDSEQNQLLILKGRLEEVLWQTKQQLKALGTCRSKLAEVMRERCRVLDLVPHSLSTVLRDNETEAILANNPLMASKVQARWGGERDLTPKIDPVGFFTLECKEGLDTAKCVCLRSRELRTEIKETVAEVVRLQKEIDECINDTLKRKIAETDALKGMLQMGKGDLRTGIFRCHRLYDEMERTHGLALGPVSSKDNLTQQRLDRPQARIHQRHPGNQLPETALLTKGLKVLESAMNTTRDDIGLLHITRLHLEDNLQDKNMGSRVDSNALRLRRRRASHRWTIDEGKQLIPK